MEAASQADAASTHSLPHSAHGLRHHVTAWPTRWRLTRWETGAAVVGLAAATAGTILTLRADFLAYPGWLAVQKADVILGPIAVGLYWRHLRPQSRFGPLLIALGLVHVPYVLQSSSDSALFTVGVHWEGPIYLATLAVILAFPSGRLARADVVVLAAGVLVVAASSTISLLSPQISAGGSISACRAGCPANALVISNEPDVVSRLVDADRWGIIGVALATAALLLFRLTTGTPPRRRALAIGTPVALVFLLVQATYQLAFIAGETDEQVNAIMRWTFVVARSLVWYGFLIALVAAELFAARVLRRIVGESLRRPTLPQLESLLRGPLGDPGLALGFWQPPTPAWVDGDGNALATPAPRSGRALTEVQHDGRPAVAIVHDAQLSDDPELLQAAGATALLALENAELQAAWSESLRELRGSRARLAAASERERHRLERDLHDGAQQALVALRIKLALAAEQVPDPALELRLRELGDDLEGAIDELRDLAHGIYPSLLAEAGLVLALRAVVTRAGRAVALTDEGIGRYPPEVEAGVYYCCREAVQNAVRHAGAAAQIVIHLRDDGATLGFEVRDDGVGFDPDARDGNGAGLRNMEDRIGLLDGRFELTSAPGAGTVVLGAVPLRS